MMHVEHVQRLMHSPKREVTETTVDVHRVWIAESCDISQSREDMRIRGRRSGEGGGVVLRGPDSAAAQSWTCPRKNSHPTICFGSSVGLCDSSFPHDPLVISGAPEPLLMH
jgi:hypothetical protein